MKKNLTCSESSVTATVAPKLIQKIKQLLKIVETEKTIQVQIIKNNQDVNNYKKELSDKKKAVKDAEKALASAQKELDKQNKKVDTLKKSVTTLQNRLMDMKFTKSEVLKELENIGGIKTVGQAVKVYNDLLAKEEAAKAAAKAEKTAKKSKTDVKEAIKEEKVSTEEVGKETVIEPTFEKKFMSDEKTSEEVVDKAVKIAEEAMAEAEKATTEEKPVDKKKKAATKTKKAVKVEEVAKVEETAKVEEKKPVVKKKKASKKKTESKVVTPPTVKPEVVVDDKVIDVEKAEVTAVTGNKKIEIVYSFDTTGSMYTVLSLVRKHIADSIEHMFNLDCELKVGVIAHGDYCDKDHPYTIMAMDLTDEKDKLKTFVKDIEPTYGGDADECYELVLRTLNNDISWSEDSTKMVVLIGDANPHGVDYRDNKAKINWSDEVDKLAKKGVSIYAVHALSYYRKSSKAFYDKMAEKTGGVYLTLDNFSDVNDLMIASLYQRFSEDKLDQYVTIIRDSGRLTRTLATNVNRLAKKNIVTDKYESIKGLNVVPAGRFQVIPVDEKCDIKGFVQNNGIMYKVGRAFYELTKTEDVQQYKEVILQDKKSGDMYFGEDTRKYLGLLPQVARSGAYAHEKIKPVKDDKYRVFVQSTSVNRKLVPGTNLLYEISESESR